MCDKRENVKKMILFVAVFLFIFSGCSVASKNDILVNKRVLDSPTDYQDYIKLSPDGKYLVSTNSNTQNKYNKVYIWDIKKEKIVHTLDRRRDGIGDSINNFIFTPDSKSLIVGMDSEGSRKDKDGKLLFSPLKNSKYLYKIDNVKINGKMVRTMNGTPRNHPANVPSMLSFSMDKFQKKLIPSFHHCGLGGCKAFKFTPDGKYLVVNKKGYLFYDAKTFKVVKHIETKIGKNFVFSDDGKFFADIETEYIKIGKDYDKYCTIPYNKLWCKTKGKHITDYAMLQIMKYYVRLWDYSTLKVIRKFKLENLRPIFTFYDNDKKIIIPGTSPSYYYDSHGNKKYMTHKAIRTDIFDIKSNKHTKYTTLEKDYLIDSAFIKFILNGKYIIKIGEKKIYIINSKTKKIIQNIELDKRIFMYSISKVTISKDKKTLAVVGDSDEIWLFDIKIPQKIKSKE